MLPTFAAPEAMGAAIAALLVLALVVALPPGGRGLARPPALFLVAHLAAAGALRVVPPDVALRRPIELLASFLLLAALAASHMRLYGEGETNAPRSSPLQHSAKRRSIA